MKILLISYLFTPIGGMTPWRLYQLIKYLDIDQVDVVTVNPKRQHPVYWIDQSNFPLPSFVNVFRTYAGLGWSVASIFHFVHNQISPKIKGIATKKNTPSTHNHPFNTNKFPRQLYRQTFRVFMIPDTRVDWFPFGYARGLGLTHQVAYDAIWSFGFPYTSHLVAYEIAKKTSIPWVIEYGDPWTFGPEVRFIPKWRLNIDHYLEQKMLSQAKRIIVCTEETKSGFIANYPNFQKENIFVIPHGFADEEFENSQRYSFEKFRIVYTGTFYDDLREPYHFLRSLTSLPPNEYEVFLIGNIGEKYKKFTESIGIQNQVVYLGVQPRRKVSEYQVNATILLSFGWEGGMQIPAKLYEYFGAKRPIFNVTNNDNDASINLITSYHRGLNVINSEDEIKRKLQGLFNLWKERQLDEKFDLLGIEAFGWKNRSNQIKSVFSGICNP